VALEPSLSSLVRHRARHACEYRRLAWLVVVALMSGCTADPTGASTPSSQRVPNVIAEYRIDRWCEPLLVPVTWEGKPAFFVLDTGFSLNAVDPNCFPLLRAVRTNASGITQLGSTRVGSIEVGGAQFHQVQLSETKSGGSLGLNFLERHLTTIDFPSHRLYLKKGMEFDRPRKLSFTAGLHLLKPNQVTVYSVDNDSAAAKAGLEGGDVLVEIDGKRLADADFYDVQDMLDAESARQVSIKYVRNDLEKIAAVALQLDDDS
jgi:hypothetical protein